MSLDEKTSSVEQVELTRFHKYQKLVEGLRKHILAYFQGSTLKNYAECSNYCNSEVQKLNTVAPETVILKDTNGGVSVTLSYKGTKILGKSIAWSHHQKKTFMYSECSNVMDDIQNYFLKCYKYVRKGNTNSLLISMKKWPGELMNVKPLAAIDDWRLTIYESMFEDFMTYVKNEKTQLKKICLFEDGKMTVPPEFFKLPFFKESKEANFFLPCRIDDCDFIETKNSLICIQGPITYEAIRQKVEKVNTDANAVYQCIHIDIPFYTGYYYNLDELFSVEQFPNKINLGEGRHQIGKVEVRICEYGKTLELIVGI